MDQRAELRQLRNENQILRRELAATQAANFTLRERLHDLEAAHRELTSQLEQRTQQLTELAQLAQTTQQQLTTLQQQLAALSLPPNPPSAPSTPPDWVKPNKPNSSRQPRRKRKPEQNNARRREPQPNRVEQHQLAHCPKCGRGLSTQRLARRRQVLELPPPQPVEVIEHQVFRGWCGQCRRWHSPKLELRSEVVGRGRIGVRLASLIATLRLQTRLPIAVIQSLLVDLYGLALSRGGIVGVLQQVRLATTAAFNALLAQARSSAVLHMDETSWRENGQNGYVWELATPGPSGVRVFVRDGSRAGAVMESLLGGKFKGVLVSDFYCGYNGYAGQHQRCWVHLLRDMHELRQQQPSNKQVAAWLQAVRQLYDRGKAAVAAYAADMGRRRAWAARLEREAAALGKMYCQQVEHPCHALAQRLVRHRGELFTFVGQAGVPAENNLAERGVRPLVVARKISGGTRSATGSVTHMQLASLFATWRARGQNGFLELQHLLRQPPDPQTALPLS